MKKENEMIECACGCGSMLKKFNSYGRAREFLPHHWARVQPNQREARSCENCGNQIMIPQWKIRKSKHNRFFCDLKCLGEYATKTGMLAGKNNGYYNTITVQCAACGADISKAASLINRRNGNVYCKDCISLTRRGRKGFYVGYPKEFSPSLRHRVRRRDKFTCQLCGRHQDQVGTLHVHHIDYDKNNNNASNLISLCRVCHGKTNIGLDAWKEKLSSLVSL
jgi:hypothetical protein